MTHIVNSSRFNYLEKILSTRISLLRALRVQEQVDNLGDEYFSPLYEQAAELEKMCLLQLSRSARIQGSLQTSMNAVTAAYKLLSPNSNSFDVQQEFAKVLWAQDEHGTAISLMKAITPIKPDDKALFNVLLVSHFVEGGSICYLLVVYFQGSWTSEARLESTREITINYFDPTISSLNPTLLPSTFSKVYGSYATFADAQLEESEREIAERRIRFNLYEKRKTAEFSVIDKQLKEAGKDSAKETLVSQLTKGRASGKVHLDEDRQQLVQAEELTKNLRWQALDNYAKALSESNEHDDKIHRFCTLWLARADDTQLHLKLKVLLAKIPSYKFVFLAYQLSARLGHNSEGDPAFAANIDSLITRMASDHPFHTLYQVNALRDSNAGSLSANTSHSSSRRRSSAASMVTSQSSREKAADKVFDKVKKIPALTARVEAIELVCQAYREWADYYLLSDEEYYTIQAGKKSSRKGSLQIKKRMLIISKVKDLPIPVSTYELPINITGDYPESELPCIVKYQSSFFTVGGIHVPKVIDCLDTRGILHRQLVSTNYV